jgi:hypothetical protein
MHGHTRLRRVTGLQTRRRQRPHDLQPPGLETIGRPQRCDRFPPPPGGQMGETLVKMGN